MIDTVPAGGTSYMDMYAKGWDSVRADRYARMLKNGVIDNTFGLSPAEPFMTPVQEIPSWASLGSDQKADLTRKMSLYAASIESVDKAVGRVVAQLKAQGEFDNTLIFVLSDNGGNYEGGVVGTAFGKPDALTGTQLTNMGQPGQVDHVQVGGGWAHVENTPFRFFKHYTHAGGVRSPLVVSWPGHTANTGGWTEQYAHVIDLAPTILQVAGVQHPDSFAGHPVLPLEGMTLVDTITKGAAPMDRQLGFEHETNRAWIEGDLKLVVRHENNDIPELYDVKADPSELHDLSAAQPAKLKHMIEQWNTWAKHVGVPADRYLTVP
jgi:arylsulfatase